MPSELASELSRAAERPRRIPLAPLFALVLAQLSSACREPPDEPPGAELVALDPENPPTFGAPWLEPPADGVLLLHAARATADERAWMELQDHGEGQPEFEVFGDGDGGLQARFVGHYGESWGEPRRARDRPLELSLALRREGERWTSAAAQLRLESDPADAGAARGFVWVDRDPWNGADELSLHFEVSFDLVAAEPLRLRGAARVTVGNPLAFHFAGFGKPKGAPPTSRVTVHLDPALELPEQGFLLLRDAFVPGRLPASGLLEPTGFETEFVLRDGDFAGFRGWLEVREDPRGDLGAEARVWASGCTGGSWVKELDGHVRLTSDRWGEDPIGYEFVLDGVSYGEPCKLGGGGVVSPELRPDSDSAAAAK